jgi:hypothetical protein
LRHIPRERVSHYKVSVNAQLFSEFSNLIPKHLSQRLDQFQLSGAVSEVQMRSGSGFVPEDSLLAKPEYTETLQNWD